MMMLKRRNSAPPATFVTGKSNESGTMYCSLKAKTCIHKLRNCKASTSFGCFCQNSLCSKLLLVSASFPASSRKIVLRVGILALLSLASIIQLPFFWHYKLVVHITPPSLTIRLSRRDSDTSGAKNSSKLVAVVIAGTLQRFQLNASIQHLLKPLVAQGHHVDYFVSLTTAHAKAYRDDSSYMSHVHWDPVFSNGTILKNRPGDMHVAITVRRSILGNGGKLRNLILRESIDINSDKLLKKHRKLALQTYPKEDPDLRFPIMDLRNDIVKKRTINGNQNILRLMLATYELWKILMQVEKNLECQYDFVMFLRDDTLWLQDLNLGQLTGGHDNIDAFALACDARDPPMESTEMNDHGIIVRRGKAKIFGDYYSQLFKVDMEACAKRLPSGFRKGGERGCNSEMILKYIVDKHRIKVHKVGQAEIPFQRSLNVVHGERITQCFHKVCQSTKNQLQDHGLQKCSALAFK